MKDTGNQAAHPGGVSSSDLPRDVGKVIALSSVCGIVEVIGYQDLGGIYPAIMTGNTVQLGWSLSQQSWARFGLLAFAVGAFFVGCMFASLIRRHLRHPAMELAMMAGLLVAAGIVRSDAGLRIALELPLLAFALAMQGETISRFGAVSLQTLVVTNNMVKFSDAFIGRYFNRRSQEEKRPALAEMLLPGLAWLTYSVSAALGAVMDRRISQPLLIPAVLLLVVTLDMLSQGRQGA